MQAEFKQVVQYIYELRLNRPEVLNALNTDLIKDLHDRLDEAYTAKDLRVLLVKGSGEKAFCVGADLKERTQMSDAQTLSFLAALNDFLNRLEAAPFATIAIINGYAFGGGLELALACDLRVMSESTQVGLTECALGIIPGAGGTQRLPRIVGFAKAKELIFSAQRIGAEEAKTIGLVNEFSSSVYELGLDIAKKIAANAPLSIRYAKQAMHAGGQEANWEKKLSREREAYVQVLKSADRNEALRAFQEKRHPIFKGL